MDIFHPSLQAGDFPKHFLLQTAAEAASLEVHCGDTSAGAAEGEDPADVGALVLTAEDDVSSGIVALVRFCGSSESFL